MTQTTTDPKRPAETVRFGSIQAAIWRNENTEGRGYFSVTFAKQYRDAKGNWQTSHSYVRDDLLTLSKVADEAFGIVHRLQTAERQRLAEQSQAQSQAGSHTNGNSRSR